MKNRNDLKPISYREVLKKRLSMNLPELKEITFTVDHTALLACTTGSEVGLKALKLPIRL